VGCLQVLGALLTVAQAALLADLVVAVVLQAQHGATLVQRLVLLGAVMSGRAGVAAAQEWVAARASSRARADLRRAVLTALTRLGPTWAGRQPAGRLVTAAGPGLEALDGYLTRAVPALTAAAVVPVVVLASIAVADWQSALVLVVTLPLVPLFMVVVGASTRRRMETQYATLARLAGHFLDLVQGLTTLKVYGQAHRQVGAVRRATDAYRVQTMQTLRVALLSGLVLDLLATLSVAVVAVDVGLRLDAGHLTLRPALLVLLLAPELFAPLRAMGAQHHASEQGRVASSMALDVLEEAGALPAAGALGCSRPAGTLRVQALRVVHPAGRTRLWTRSTCRSSRAPWWCCRARAAAARAPCWRCSCAWSTCRRAASWSATPTCGSSTRSAGAGVRRGLRNARAARSRLLLTKSCSATPGPPGHSSRPR